MALPVQGIFGAPWAGGRQGRPQACLMSWGLDGGPSLGSLTGDRTRGQPLEPLISWLTHVLLIAINTQENSSIPTSHVTTTATRLADTVTGRALCAMAPNYPLAALPITRWQPPQPCHSHLAPPPSPGRCKSPYCLPLWQCLVCGDQCYCPLSSKASDGCHLPHTCFSHHLLTGKHKL